MTYTTFARWDFSPFRARALLFFRKTFRPHRRFSAGNSARKNTRVYPRRRWRSAGPIRQRWCNVIWEVFPAAKIRRRTFHDIFICVHDAHICRSYLFIRVCFFFAPFVYYIIMHVSCRFAAQGKRRDLFSQSCGNSSMKIVFADSARRSGRISIEKLFAYRTGGSGVSIKFFTMFSKFWNTFTFFWRFSIVIFVLK